MERKTNEVNIDRLLNEEEKKTRASDGPNNSNKAKEKIERKVNTNEASRIAKVIQEMATCK